MPSSESKGPEPKKVGPYRIHRMLGTGGMGVVYLGERSKGELVAIKVVRPEFAEDATFRSRFRQEVRVASRVKGTCTARVVDADVEARLPYMVTEYVPGPTLDDAIQESGALEGDQLRAFAVALAEALNAIHEAGLIHRDLKPSNVLLSQEGPRVIDFGIARAADITAITRTGMTVGTPQWMSPEQVRGREIGPSSDVFCWGALVTFAGTGRLPFGEGAAEAVMYRIVHEKANFEGLDPAMRMMVERALSKNPRERPQVLDLLHSLLGDGSIGESSAELTAPVIEMMQRTWDAPALEDPNQPRRRKRLWIPATLMILLLLGVGGWFLAPDLLDEAEQRPSGEVVEPSDALTQSGSSSNPEPELPSARDQSTEKLIKKQAEVETKVYGDLDGELPEEIVVASADDPKDPFSQRYVDIFGWNGSRWRRIFNASKFISPEGGEPLLPLVEGGFAGSEITFLQTLDFEEDGSDEVAVGVQRFGASSGPLDLWILGGGDSGFDLLYEDSTTRGGGLSQKGSTLILETGSYTAADALCCPSFMLTQRIGARGGGIQVLSESEEPASDSDAPLSEDSRLRLDGIGGVTVGMTLAEASEAAGVSIETDGPSMDGCNFAYPSSGPQGLSFMVLDGRIARSDVDEGSIITLSGVGIGAPEDVVMNTYPGQIEVSEHPYDPSGNYLTYIPEDDSGLLLIFATDGSTVTSFRSGQEDAVRAIEGCS